jgi:hypothetical protein
MGGHNSSLFASADLLFTTAWTVFRVVINLKRKSKTIRSLRLSRATLIIRRDNKKNSLSI